MAGRRVHALPFGQAGEAATERRDGVQPVLKCGAIGERSERKLEVGALVGIGVVHGEKGQGSG